MRSIEMIFVESRVARYTW